MRLAVIAGIILVPTLGAMACSSTYGAVDDGAPDASVNDAPAVPDSTSAIDGQATEMAASSAMTVRSNAFTVGARSGGGSYFPGTIDEVAVYDKALGLARVVAHFEAR